MLTDQEQSKTVKTNSVQPISTIAIMPLADVWEDFLDSIGVSLETFCTDGPGGWLLGYIDALRLVGMHSVLVLLSAVVIEPTHYHHAPTGATIVVLPVSKQYLWIRRQIANPNPYLAENFDQMVGDVQGGRRVWLKLLSWVAPYLAIPFRQLAKELRREGCQAILCQDYESSQFDAYTLLGKRMKLSVYASFQGGCCDSNPIKRAIRFLAIKACDGLVIGPQTEIQQVQKRYGVRSSKIAQIFNPIDLRLWSRIDRNRARQSFDLPLEAQIVVWHGRIEMQTKRLDILLNAWEKICVERPQRDLRLFLLGTGQDAEALRQRIAALPIQNVHWINRYTTDRTEIRHFLSTGDVYAFPSMFEGFPVAPLEAMACGLPLVAAAASGVPDILKAGEQAGGLLVPCGDVAAFASALARVLDQPDWGRELGNRARCRVEEAFSLEAVGQQFLNFFSRGQSSNHDG